MDTHLRGDADCRLHVMRQFLRRRVARFAAALLRCCLGMEKASMSQIAQEAGVSKSLLYHYY
ncbi:MAG: helix-turn-helix domain-containing protein, partial [Pseudomonadota bacterium]